MPNVPPMHGHVWPEPASTLMTYCTCLIITSVTLLPAFYPWCPLLTSPPPCSQIGKVIRNCKEILRMMQATGDIKENVVRDTLGNNPDTSKALRL